MPLTQPTTSVSPTQWPSSGARTSPSSPIFHADSPARRFVNSLVDPLQTTYFARSIASLAQQIQLPLWFVELRHQATHENLPSLGVLRDAARQVSLRALLRRFLSRGLVPATRAGSSGSKLTRSMSRRRWTGSTRTTGLPRSPPPPLHPQPPSSHPSTSPHSAPSS